MHGGNDRSIGDQQRHDQTLRPEGQQRIGAIGVTIHNLEFKGFVD